jgi:hypothetical protein
MPETLKTLLFALSLCFFAPLAGAEAMFVHGSWVNVRETAAADAAVIEHVTTNTPVEVVAREGKTCEIVWRKADEKRGFVACRLLGEKALKLEDVNGITSQYLPLRAFWIAPSAYFLMEAGEYFEQTLLSEKQRNLENQEIDIRDEQAVKEMTPPPLLRWPVPEFEAMKALLAKGIVADASIDPLQLNCLQLETIDRKSFRGDAVSRSNLNTPWACQAPSDLEPLVFPKISTSFFKTAEGILRGLASIEQISAHFGIVERGWTSLGPSWGMHCSGNEAICSLYYDGAWDIGDYGLKLEQPVFEHVIGRDGRISVYQWTPFLVRDSQFYIKGEDDSYECDKFMNWRQGEKSLLPDYSAATNAMFWFQSPVPLPFKQARILQHKTGVVVKDSSKIPIESYEIDLDGDGIADFAQWDFDTQNVTSPDFSDGGPSAFPLRVVFININGEWYPFEKYFVRGCGC